MQRRPTSVYSLVLLAGVLTALVSACSTTALPQPLDKATARSVANAVVYGDGAIVSMFKGDLNVGASAMAPARGSLSTMAACVTQSPPFPVDADHDKIPLTKTVSFDCNQAQDGYDGSGSYRIVDHNDNDPLSGFEQHMDRLSVGLPGVVTVGLDGSLKLRKSFAQYRLDATLALTVDGSDDSASVRLDAHPTYSPTVPEDPFAGGHLTLDGAITFTAGGQSYHLTRASSGVTFDGTCQQSFTAGTITYTDSEGNLLVITYTGCNAFTATFNGGSI